MRLPPGLGMNEADEPLEQDKRTATEKEQEKNRKSLQADSDRQREAWKNYSADRFDMGDWVRIDKLSKEGQEEAALADEVQKTTGSFSNHLTRNILKPGFYRNTKTQEAIRLRSDGSVVALPLEDRGLFKTGAFPDEVVAERYARQINFLASGKGAGAVRVDWPGQDGAEYVTNKYLTMFMKEAEAKFATVEFGENVYAYFEQHPDQLKSFEEWQQRLVQQREAHLKSEEYKLYEQAFDYKLSNRALNLNEKLTSEREQALKDEISELTGNERLTAIDKNLKEVEARYGTLEFEKDRLETRISEQTDRLTAIEAELSKEDLDADQIRQLNSELEKVRETINAHKAERDNLFVNLGNEAKDLQANLDIWGDALTKDSGQLKTAKDKFEQSKQEVDKLKGEVDKLAEEVKKGKDDNKAYEDNLNKLNEKIKNLDEKQKSAKDTYDKSLDNKSGKSIDEIKKLNKEATDLQVEKEKATKEKDDFINKNPKSGVDFDKKASELENKRKDLSERITKISEDKKKFDAEDTRFQTTHKNYEELKKKLADTNTKLTSFKQETDKIPERLNNTKLAIETKSAEASSKAKP